MYICLSMQYIILIIILFVAELLYFRVADHFNIIDKPNERSSHSTITLRGGGIIFYLAALAYFIVSGGQYAWFLLGLTMMTTVSFIDDVYTLSNRIRLIIHFTSVGLMAFELEALGLPWYVLLPAFIFIVGTINIYNFMDGINGITAAYSLAVGGLLMLVNAQIDFIAQDLLAYTMCGLLVFSFFNFRHKAKCFAGDVGSVAIIFILLFALGALILKTQNFIYILFLTIYGIDSVFTLFRRMYLRENIFEAHRSHLYQFLGNEAGVNILLISVIYGLLQFGIGLLVIQAATWSTPAQWQFAIGLVGGLVIVYLVLKTWVIRRFVINRI